MNSFLETKFSQFFLNKKIIHTLFCNFIILLFMFQSAAYAANSCEHLFKSGFKAAVLENEPQYAKVWIEKFWTPYNNSNDGKYNYWYSQTWKNRALSGEEIMSKIFEGKSVSTLTDKEVFKYVLKAVNSYSEQTPESERIYAAVQYVNSKTKEKKWVRLNIDPIPHEDWIQSDAGEVNSSDFFKMMQNGLFPFSPRMITHDINHVLPFTHISNFAAQMVELYHQLSLKSNGPQRHHDMLSEFTLEFLDIPNIKDKKLIQNLFPNSIDNPELLTTSQIHEIYSGKPLNDTKLSDLYSALPQLLIKLGGAIGQSDFASYYANRNQAGYLAWQILDAKAQQAPVLYPDFDHKFYKMSRRTLTYFMHEYKELYETYLLVNDPSNNGKHPFNEGYKQAILERLLWRFSAIEAAVTNAYKTKLTPADLISQILSLNFSPSNSEENPTLLKYYQSFLPADSYPLHILFKEFIQK